MVSSTEISITWESVPPMHQNGLLITYEVQYEPLETFGGEIQTQTRNVSVTMENVSLEVEAFVVYNISVRAYTSAGAGPYSTEITVMTAEDGE